MRKELTKFCLLTGLIPGLILIGCGRKDHDTASNSSQPSKPSVPTVQNIDRPADVPPPPAQKPGGSATTEDDSPSPKGLSDLERLNWAMQMYHIAHLSSPPLTDYVPLVEAKLIREVPVAPAGKKFVLNGPGWEVRLENAK